MLLIANDGSRERTALNENAEIDYSTCERISYNVSIGKAGFHTVLAIHSFIHSSLSRAHRRDDAESWERERALG